MTDPQSNDIAIIGMAAHLPDARNVAEFWKNLRNGHESVRELTDEELEAAGVSRSSLADPDYVKAAVVLDGIEEFDASFFGLTPKDAAIMDPQHRHFLSCAWEALEDAGHTADGFDGSIGVYAGCGMGAYFMFNVCSNPELVDQVGLFLLRHTGNDKDFLATRVSYELNLKGPSVNIQTACSTSAVAIHSAAQSLLAGECDMALAGGVTILMPHGRGYRYEENEVLSPDGHCRAFDKNARGTVFGSGAGVVVLRRLEDAIADGDDIRAVIKGSAINNDGLEKVGFLAPSVDGQADAIAEAIAVAGIDADTISYVEAHGTGTAVGDPIEIAALTSAFRETTNANGFCRIGSVKTNIGHLDTAAGVASVIKVAEALRHRELPPTLNFEAPNEAIDFASTPFVVNSELHSWDVSNHPRRAGISSLGVGGTNAHIVLEEAPEVAPSERAPRPYHLFCLSAKSGAALDRNGRQLGDWFGEQDAYTLADASWTLRHGRVPFEKRRVFAASSAEEAKELLESMDAKRVFDGSASTTSRDVAFLLPGGGAQYPGMARDLYDSEPIYRETFEACLAACESELADQLRGLILAEESEREHAAKELQRPSLQLPALFIVSYSLAKLWMELGVQPAILAGHSLGQNTAACLAGVFSLKDAMGLVCLRGRLVESTEAGAMTSVSMPATWIREHLADGLCLAAINGPELCAVSGALAAIEKFESELAAQEIDFTRIRVSTAGHSHLLDPILPEFQRYLESIQLNAPALPLLCNRTGERLTDEQATDPAYWTAHLRNTVDFVGCVETLEREGNYVLMEVGPGTVLGSLSRMTAPKSFGKASFNSLRHRDDVVHDQAFLLTAMGRLWACGVAVNWSQLDGTAKRHRIPLPTYAFEQQRYWIEPGTGSLGHGVESDVMLRKLEKLDDWFAVPEWRESENSPAKVQTESWLVFADDSVLSAAFLESLSEKGQRVAVVRPGREFAAEGSHEYRIDPSDREGYSALLQELSRNEFVPQRVAHLWMVTESEETAATTNFFHLVQERGFYSLLFLGQALSDSAFETPLQLGVVSNGMQAMPGEQLAYPEKALVLGPCRVLPREMTNIACKTVDVTLPKERWFGRTQKEHAELAAKLFDELRSDTEDVAVALRGERRFAEFVQPHAIPTSEERALRKNAVVLVTGGMGGIGAAMAEHLVREHQARVVLIGRTPLPERESWRGWLASHSSSDPVCQKIRAVQRLEALGSEVMTASADVANREQMSAVVANAQERFGKIHGVLHAAGVIEDSVIGMKDPSSVDRVFSPKVHGTLVLESLLDLDSLDFFVLFSSTSSLLGLVGQVDYTAANAFLNAFAHSRSAAGAKGVVAIDWGIWKDVGMAAGSLGVDEAIECEAIAELGERVEHPLLGSRVVNTESETIFLATYSVESLWVLDDHRLATGEALVPGTGYLEIARAAFRESGSNGGCELSDFEFLAPLGVRDSEERQVRVLVRHDEDGQAIEIASRDDEQSEWNLHARGRMRALPQGFERSADLAEIKTRCALGTVALTSDGRIAEQQQHIAFGPRWQVLQSIDTGTAEGMAHVRLAPEFAEDLSDFQLHPALFDLCTGFAHSLAPGHDAKSEFLAPMSYESVRIHSPLIEELWSHARLNDSSNDEIACFDVRVFDGSGSLLVEVHGFRCRRVRDTKVLAAAPAAQDSRNGGALEDGPLQVLLREGIAPREGADCLTRVLRNQSLHQVVVSSLPFDALQDYVRESHAPAEGGLEASFERPELDSEFAEPRDEVESTLVKFWSELLGVDRVGIDDDFFELGGYSLIAVRLFAKVRKQYQLEFPLSILFEAPTVSKLAAIVRSELGLELGEESRGEVEVARPKWTHLVPMHVDLAGTKKAERSPFFLCAGMFGNVMNLRHLAGHVGADQPFYGLQAKGVDGKSEPHRTFEEQAAAYLEEVRKVQPHGPYYLGGFSGGGIVAYEMAQQLRAAGEEVGVLIMLDSWVPKETLLSKADRREMHAQRFRSRGLRYAWEILFNRFQRAKKRWMRKIHSALGRIRPYDYTESKIEVAFRAALVAYDTPNYEGNITLFRPELDVAHELSSGNRVSSNANYVYHDNDWSRHCSGEIEVHEVPGDHDNMVLEPNVRVLAALMRECIDRAEGEQLSQDSDSALSKRDAA